MAATRLEPAGNGVDCGLLSVHQVAQRLGCSVSLVQKWRRLGWLPATRLGTADVAVYGYRLEDVERFAGARWNRRRGRPPKSGAAVAPPDQPPRARPIASEARATPGAGASGPAAAHGRADAGDTALGEGSAGQTTGVAGTSGTASPRTPEGGALLTLGGEPGRAFPPIPRDRPLVLWDGDPREQRVLLLARFTTEQEAERIADLWSRRYDTLALGELKGADGRPVIYAIWRDGRRVS